MSELASKDLAWWCRLGRFMAGHDTHPDGSLKPVVKLEKPGPLEAAEKRVILEVIDRCGGNIEQAVKHLDMSRATLYGRLRKWGYTRASNVVKIAACGMVLCGCAMPTVSSSKLQVPRATHPAPRIANSPAISSSLVMAPEAADVPTKIRTTFAFVASPDASVTGYKLYYGPTSRNYTNSVDLGTNLTATIEHDGYPIIAAATAYNAAGDESVFSNEAGVLGTQTIVRGYDQRAASPDGPFADADLVFTRTNPPTTFHRLRIESVNELQTFP